jgi:hypothetical protein
LAISIRLTRLLKVRNNLIARAVNRYLTIGQHQQFIDFGQNALAMRD